MPKCFILSIYYKITNVVLKVIFDKDFYFFGFLYFQKNFIILFTYYYLKWFLSLL